MTDEEAQRAFVQQTPVMWRVDTGRPWRGPTVVIQTFYGRYQVEGDLSGVRPFVRPYSLRLATAHDLLTADEDDG